MALIEHNLFGEVNDKVARAVDIARSFCPPEGFIYAYSGGKDSQVLGDILDIAGVPYEKHYNVTTVDPPELVRFIISQHEFVIYDMPDGTHKYYSVHSTGKLLRRIEESGVTGKRIVHFDIPEMSMRRLIAYKKIPPTRLMRYCCEYLKESYNAGQITVTGVRANESLNRKKNQGAVTIFDGEIGKLKAEESGVNFTSTVRGGVVLNYDDDAARRTVEHCYRTSKVIVNPIINFTEADVWEYIRTRNIPYCSLYDEGWRRLGCVGCPMGGFATQRREFQRWPQYRKLYVRAFDEMLQARKEAGKNNHNRLWVDGEGIMRWWTGYDQGSNPDQIDIFSELEE